MRLKVVPSRHSIKIDRGMYETHMEAPIYIKYKPEGEFDLIPKSYVDDAIANIDLNKMQKIISKDLFPNYEGDFIKRNGEFFLKDSSGLTNGHLFFNIKDNGLTFDSKRKIPAEALGEVSYDSLDKNTFPNSPEGLGITDFIKLDGNGFTNGGLNYYEAGVRPEQPVTHNKAHEYFRGLVEYDIGDIISVKYGSNLTGTDFMRANGASIPVSQAPELAQVLANTRSVNLESRMIAPWKMTESEELGDITSASYDTINSNYMDNLAGFAFAVVKKNVYVIGGYRGDRRKPLNSVYKYELLPDGKLGKCFRLGDLPEARVFSKALIVNNILYVIGGSPDPSKTIINVDVLYNELDQYGELTIWKKMGNPLKDERSNFSFVAKDGKLVLLGGIRHLGMEGDLSLTEPAGGYASTSILEDGTLTEWIYVDNRTLGVNDADLIVDGNNLKAFTKGDEFSEGTLLADIETDYLESLNLNNRIALDNDLAYGSIRTLVVVDKYNRGLKNIFIISNDNEDESSLSKKGLFLTDGLKEVLGNFIPKDVVGWDENPQNRNFFEVFITRDYVYILGGIPGNPLQNYDRTLGQPIIEIEIPGVGSNDYTNLTSEKPMARSMMQSREAMFTLPNIPDYNWKNVVYSYYIKFR